MKTKTILLILIAMMCLAGFTGTYYAKTQITDMPYEYETYANTPTALNNDAEYTTERSEICSHDMRVLDDDVQIPEEIMIAAVTIDPVSQSGFEPDFEFPMPNFISKG